MLEELTELSRTVREALPQDRPIQEFDAARRRREMGAALRDLPDAMTFRDFGRLSTASLACRLRVNDHEARKIQMEILLEALTSADPQCFPEDLVEEPDESMHERTLRFAVSALGTAQPGERNHEERDGQDREETR